MDWAEAVIENKLTRKSICPRIDHVQIITKPTRQEYVDIVYKGSLIHMQIATGKIFCSVGNHSQPLYQLNSFKVYHKKTGSGILNLLPSIRQALITAI